MTLNQLVFSLTSDLKRKFPPIQANWKAPEWLKAGAVKITNQVKPYVQNLQSWGQVARNPQLRQEYTRQVVQPAIQRRYQQVKPILQQQYSPRAQINRMANLPVMPQTGFFETERVPVKQYVPLKEYLKPKSYLGGPAGKSLAGTVEQALPATIPMMGQGVPETGKLALNIPSMLKSGASMATFTAAMNALQGKKQDVGELASSFALGVPFGMVSGLKVKGGEKAVMEAERLKGSKIKIKAPGVPPGMKERGFIETVKEATTTIPEVAEKVKGFYKPITNKETMAKAQQIVSKGYDTAKERVFKEPLTADTNAIGQEIMRRAQIQGRYDEAIEMAETLAVKGTTAGQSVQAFSIWSRLTPEGMLRYATKTVTQANEKMGVISKTVRKTLGKQPTKIEVGDAKFITETMKKAQQATTEEEKAYLVGSVMETINKKIPWGVSDVVDEYRYANMLSNPLTHLRNAWSNLIQTYFTRPATLAAEGRPVEAIKYELGAIKALPEALSGFTKAIKKPKGFGRLDEPAMMTQRRLGRWNLPSDLMEGADVFFRTLIEGGEKARGISAEEATKIGEYSLFRGGLKPEEQGYLLNKIDDLTKATYGLRKVGLGWFIPFIRTPMNVAKQWIEYSPAGIATLPGATDKRTQMAKTLLGSMATLLGAHWALQGKVTWQAPTDPKQKELYYASGRKPFSAEIGGKWVPLMTFGVFALALGIPASFKYHTEESRTALTDGDLEKLIKISLSSVNFWTQQTFVSGLGSFVKLMEGDQDYTLVRNLTQPVDQLKPMAGFLRYVSTIVDPIFRKPGTFTEQLKSGVPFLTKDIPPYTEPTGEPSKRNIFQYITPYGVGIEKPEYEQPLQERTIKLQQNARGNQLKKDFETWTKTGSQGPVTQELMAGMIQELGSKTYQARFHKLVKKGADPMKAYQVLSKQKRIETLKREISGITNDNSLTPQQKIQMKRPLVEELKKLKGGR